MPYATVADLPPAFKSLPAGAKSIAISTMNAILEGKDETQELVTQAVQAAWANIKRDYRRGAGGTWIKKWFTFKASPAMSEAHVPGVIAVHDLLAAEMRRRNMRHLTPMEKAAEKPDLNAVEKFVIILKRDDEKRIVYGIVLEPGDPKHVDSQGDWLKPDEIETAAHDWMRRYRKAKAGMGLQHEKAAPEVDVVECSIAPADYEMNGQKVKKGSWVLASYVGDDKIWKMVKDGELTGYSIGGTGERVVP